MKIDEAISVMNVIVHMLEPQYDTDRIEEAVEMAIKALKQQVTDAVDRVTIKEYLDSFGKDTNVTTTSELSSIRHELLERKDELVSFGQLIERFDDVDAEYGGSPWTLKQIYANINMLMGIERVESPSYNGVKTELSGDADCIRRSDVCFTNFEIVMCNGDYKEGLKMLLDKIEKAPSVTPQPKMGKWISNAEDDLKISEYTCSNCKGLSDEDSDFCPKCGSYNGCEG